jgi:2-polyprenyl-3-methyl-5-hydroxy-6-metoxy-1,4-benzoquinol methylase
LLVDRAIVELEQVAWRLARQWFGDRVRGRELPSAILELSSLYNARAGEPARGSPRDERLLPARLLFFTLADLPKPSLALAELWGESGPAPGPDPGLAVLDLGAGCGTMTLGAAALLASRPRLAADPPARLEVTALDSDDDALGLARQLADESGLPIALEARHHDLSRQPPPGDRRYSLILAGTLLNELAPDRRLPLVRELLARLTAGGALTLIEPATREHSRSLLHLRDRLLEAGEASIVGPCTRHGPCPALAAPGDWCHECRLWSPPPELRALAAATGLRRRDLVYSYLTVRPGDAALPPRPGAWRVVSAPLRSKGKHELVLCGEPGRLRVSLLLRHRSESNQPFLRAERGQLLWLEGELQETGRESLRIGAGTRVLRIDPAASALDPAALALDGAD